MRIGLLVVIILAILALSCVFRGKIFESFSSTDTLQLSWTPSGPNPANIAYNWGACISKGAGNSPTGQCSTQTPAYPPGPPGSGWDYHGQTAQGQASLTLNDVNCGMCGYGQVLTLMLQAVDVVNPAKPTSAWATFTLDLSSKATVVKSVITDSVATSEPIYPGSVGFVYTLQLNEPAMAAGNVAKVQASVIRGSQYFIFPNSYIPFTNISPDGTTGTYSASFTSVSPGAPWSPSAPGPLQDGDILNVDAFVYSSGNSQSDGTVYYIGRTSQTATTITPSTPTGIVWNAS